MAGPAGMVMGMFAATATHGYVARVGDDIIMTTVLDVVLLKSTLAMLKDPKGLGLDPEIQKTARTQMPTHTVTENYWNVTPVLGMMAMFAPPPQGQPLPAKLPPIAMATAVEKSGVVVRIYMPTSVIVSIKNTAMGVMNMIQPGAIPAAGLPIPGLPQAPKNAPRRAP